MRVVEWTSLRHGGIEYGLWVPDEKGNAEVVLGGTTCTDYITDFLMYPEKPLPIPKTITAIPRGSLRVVVMYRTRVELYLKYCLKEVQRIERKNGIARTKVVQDGDFLIITASSAWRRNTFMLSLYLKFWRNFHSKVTPNFLKVVPDFASLHIVNKIIYSGYLKEVNKGCKWTHGWIDENKGNHSNNGIYYTEWAYNHNEPDKSQFKRLDSIKDILGRIGDKTIEELMQ